MDKYLKVSDDGTLVTDNGIPPPMHWDNSYEDMGGDDLWGEDGDIVLEIRGRGLEGDIRLHYGTAPYTGESLYLFEIKDKSDLKSIVDIIDDPDQGLSALDFEEI